MGRRTNKTTKIDIEATLDLLKTNLSVGDKAKVKNLDWYEANEKHGCVPCGNCTFERPMTRWCGKC